MIGSTNFCRQGQFAAVCVLAAVLSACSAQGGTVQPQSVLPPVAMPTQPQAERIATEEDTASEDPAVTTGPIVYVDDSNSMLWTVNLGTNTIHRVGPQGTFLTDLAFDPRNHVLYGISYSGFYRVSTTTGIATYIGPLGLYTANALVFDANGRGYTEGFAAPELYAINNVAAGQVSPIGRTGSWESSGDLTFYNNTLVLSGNDGAATDAIVTLNRATGAVLSVAQTNLTNLYGLVSPSASHLYGFSNASLYRIFPSATTVAQRTVLLKNFASSGVGQIEGAAYNGNFQL